MYRIVRQTIEKYHMLAKGESVVVGVSGGADSCALLHVLCSLRQELSLKLIAVHVHHGLRAQEADEDEAFVKAFCEQMQVELTVAHFEIAKLAKQEGIGEEEMGRRARYEEFNRVKTLKGAQKIAVAHNKNDQAETILMRLVRGAGLTGLCGIAPVRGDIIRPLLFCEREEIEDYCQENGIRFRTDSTNLLDSYTRNKIRLTLLPWLKKELNCSVVRTLSDTASRLSMEEEYLNALAKDAYQNCLKEESEQEIYLDVQVLKKEQEVLQRRVVRLCFRHLVPGAKDMSYAHVESVLALLNAQTGKEIHLPLGVCVQKEYNLVKLFCESTDKNADKTSGYCYNIGSNDILWIKEAHIFVKVWVSEGKNEIKSINRYTKAFDYDKINLQLSLRSRRAGDVLRLKGGTKKLKDFFIDEKVPRAQRDKIPLLSCGSDILWVLGMRGSEYYLAGADTKKILWMEYWEDV